MVVSSLLSINVNVPNWHRLTIWLSHLCISDHYQAAMSRHQSIMSTMPELLTPPSQHSSLSTEPTYWQDWVTRLTLSRQPDHAGRQVRQALVNWADCSRYNCPTNIRQQPQLSGPTTELLWTTITRWVHPVMTIYDIDISPTTFFCVELCREPAGQSQHLHWEWEQQWWRRSAAGRCVTAGRGQWGRRGSPAQLWIWQLASLSSVGGSSQTRNIPSHSHGKLRQPGIQRLSL